MAFGFFSNSTGELRNPRCFGLNMIDEDAFSLLNETKTSLMNYRLCGHDYAKAALNPASAVCANLLFILARVVQVSGLLRPPGNCIKYGNVNRVRVFRIFL